MRNAMGSASWIWRLSSVLMLIRLAPKGTMAPCSHLRSTVMKMSYCGIIITYCCAPCIKILKKPYIYFVRENLSLEQRGHAFWSFSSKCTYEHYLQKLWKTYMNLIPERVSEEAVHFCVTTSVALESTGGVAWHSRLRHGICGTVCVHLTPSIPNYKAS
jgi:hypothetical protein